MPQRYRNPVDMKNPFFTSQPVTFTARNVRNVPGVGIVAQPADQMFRITRRADYHRAYPVLHKLPPHERNFPEHGQLKKMFDWETGA